MVHISNDIVVEIFLRLPIKSLMRFRCVRKSWNKFLTPDSDFVKKHLLHSIEKKNYTLVGTCESTVFLSIDYDPSLSNEVIQNQIDYPFKSKFRDIKIFGSCNGLLFFDAEWLTGLWNPATREYRIIPKPETPAESDWASFPVRNYGFGYDCVNDEYKLVMILSPYSSCDEIMVSKVEVYTMSSNSWKRIKDIPYRIRDGRLKRGVFVHDALHWLADPCPIRSNNSQVLLSFNMETEVFCELPLLETFEDNNRFKYKCVDVLDGFLCMLCSHSSVGFEVWVMKDYGVRDSWTKRYTISRSEFDGIVSSFLHIRRIQSLKNGVLLEIECKDEIFPSTALVFYDQQEERFSVREIDVRNRRVSTDDLSSMFHTETYVESLVSLHSGTYVGGGEEESYLDEAMDGWQI